MGTGEGNQVREDGVKREREERWLELRPLGVEIWSNRHFLQCLKGTLVRTASNEVYGVSTDHLLSPVR